MRDSGVDRCGTQGPQIRDSTVSSSDFAGLRALRSATGDDFAAGVLLYLGNRSFTIEPGLHAVPVDRLWTSAA